MWCKTLRPGSPDKQESQISLRYLAPCIAAVSDQWGNKIESSRMRNGTTSRTSKALFLKISPMSDAEKEPTVPADLRSYAGENINWKFLHTLIDTILLPVTTS